MIETKTIAMAKTLCKCGCGQKAIIATKTDARRGPKKGEYLDYIPGHKVAKKGKSEVKVDILIPTAKTPEEIDDKAIETIRQWSDEDAAVFLNERMRWLEKHNKGIFIECGLISLEMDRRKLFERINDKDGNPYTSLDRWLAEAAPFSRSGAYASMKALKQLSDVSIGDLREMPQCNVKILAKLSSKTRKKTLEIEGKKLPIIEAAKIVSEKQFLDHIEEQHPDQHIEGKRAMNLKPDKSVREVIDHAIEVAQWALPEEAGQTREETLDFICNFFLDSPCDMEGKENDTFRTAYLEEHE